MTGQILLDLTGLAAAPHHSGIQRVERQVLRHWPDRAQLLPCVLDPAGPIRWLDDAATAVLCPASDDGGDVPASRRALARLIDAAPMLAPGPRPVILNLELFHEQWRAQAYRRMCRTGWRVRWLVYDFIPWLRPDLFRQGTIRFCMDYLTALREVPQVAFLSEETRTDYRDRVMRSRGRGSERPGPVLTPGADGLGLERQAWSPARRDIVLLGTLERRKNTHAALAAFRLLWARGPAPRLVLAGQVSMPLQQELAEFLAEAGPERAVLLEDRPDAEVREALRRARAVLFPSEAEGFGLPPMEAAQCGIPAIAATRLPSMRLLPRRGHIRLQEVSAEALADAVTALMDDATAARLWAEAAGATLPSWRGFARAVADWVAEA
jgi:glycosyltransferase involved in cell wall biosynthesis